MAKTKPRGKPPAVPNPKGLPIIEATKPYTITVEAGDIKGAAKLDAHRCALAKACVRQGAAEAWIYRRRSYLIYPDKIMRYNTPESAAREIIAIDRGGAFAPGVYTLKPVPKRERLVQNGGRVPSGPPQVIDRQGSFPAPPLHDDGEVGGFVMPDFTLSCPDCGGAIVHQCQTQPRRNPDATLEVAIAHGFKTSKLSTKRTPYNQGYDPLFLEFWNVYPRKRDKRKALFAWRNALARANATVILQGARRYREDPNRIDQFTKYAEGWLNGDGWEDEPLPQRTNGKVDKAQLIRSRIEGVRRERSASGGPGGEAPSSLSPGGLYR